MAVTITAPYAIHVVTLVSPSLHEYYVIGEQKHFLRILNGTIRQNKQDEEGKDHHWDTTVNAIRQQPTNNKEGILQVVEDLGLPFDFFPTPT